MIAPLGNDQLRELDHRRVDGVDVWLLWRESDDRVLVAVVDDTSGARFGLEVHAGESALDVFRHPYVYAAERGIDVGSRCSS
jgi:hypothetical protein